MPRVIVIGAGVSGLAFAKTYLHLTNHYASSSPPKPVEKFPHPSSQSTIPELFTSSLEHQTEAHDILIVDENPSLGGSWCRSRMYPSLYTQNALGTYEFSDMPLEGEGVANEAGYIAGWKLEEYLVAWSEKWELRGKMRFGVKVHMIYRDLTTNEWVLDIIHKPSAEGKLSACTQGSGKKLKLYCDKLVLAVGISSEPNKPYIPGQRFVEETGSSATIIHSVELGDWSRENLRIDVNYHHELSIVPKEPMLVGDRIQEILKRSREKPLPTVVETRCPPTPPSPITPSEPAPPIPVSLKKIAIYGGRKSAFDIVYFFATLPPHLRPVEIHWTFRPSISTPSRFAAPFVKASLPFNLQLPVWIQEILPTVSVRMDELMATRLMGLFERCGFESSNGWTTSWGALLDRLPGIRGRGKGKAKNLLGLHNRTWGSWFLQETRFGRALVNGFWSALDKTWEADEGIIGPRSGDIYKLRSGTSSGSCLTSFLITNQPGFWDIVRQSNIHIYRTGIKSILRSSAQNGIGNRDTGLQLHLDDGNIIPDIELLVMATGWKSSLPFTFDPPELPARIGLPYTYRRPEGASVDNEVQDIINPRKSSEALAQPPISRIPETAEDPRNDVSPTNLTLPLRLFRNMVSPELTTSPENDRSLLVLGMAKSWQTMIVSEVQALWGAVYLLGGFDGKYGENSNDGELRLNKLSKENIEERIAVFEEFSKVTGGGVLLVDSLKYCDVLLQDLGLNPWRKSMGEGWWLGWKDWIGVHRPCDYRGIVDEWMRERRMDVVG